MGVDLLPAVDDGAQHTEFAARPFDAELPPVRKARTVQRPPVVPLTQEAVGLDRDDIPLDIANAGHGTNANELLGRKGGDLYDLDIRFRCEGLEKRLLETLVDGTAGRNDNQRRLIGGSSQRDRDRAEDAGARAARSHPTTLTAPNHIAKAAP